jgi:hypothetical protein
VVHGSTKLKPDKLLERSSDGVCTLMAAWRALLEERPNLAACNDRGDRLIYGLTLETTDQV